MQTMSESTSQKCNRLGCDRPATKEVTYDERPEQQGFDEQEGCWKIRLHYRRAKVCDDHLSELREAYTDVAEQPIQAARPATQD